MSLFIEKSKELNLYEHAEYVKQLHLRDLLEDEERNAKCCVKEENYMFDYSRQHVTEEILIKLYQLYDELHIQDKINAMFNGEKINQPEDRNVLHVALRMPKNEKLIIENHNIINDIHQVLDSIQQFTDKVRSGLHKGVTGKYLKNVISIGIGGSYLGPEFVFEALKTDPEASNLAKNRSLKFLANVDPTDILRATMDFDPEETLVVIISKTFTTSETMLNARTLRNWLISKIPNYPKDKIISQHMIAVSAAVSKVVEFGIANENIFGFWDWVGGRYSVCSAVGIVPLALHYGYSTCEKFLSGAHNVDIHFKTSPVHKNIPVLMGLLGLWNSTFMKYPCRAILPYTQALLRFPAHIQQLDMESNGKHVTNDGEEIIFDCGPINFGEPGTNGQHSFYQLIHQGRVVPCEFIGYCIPQYPIELTNEKVSNHDELMSNFFAQPDALAKGKTIEQNIAEGIPMPLAKHKEFQGNRPSFSLLFTKLDAYSCGQLLALYEHRTAVEGFLWGLNSFDQWGVELGKTLATQIRNQIIDVRKNSKSIKKEDYNSSTINLLGYYFKKGKL